jgi:hypothetical protein
MYRVYSTTPYLQHFLTTTCYGNTHVIHMPVQHNTDWMLPLLFAAAAAAAAAILIMKCSFRILPLVNLDPAVRCVFFAAAGRQRHDAQLA